MVSHGFLMVSYGVPVVSHGLPMVAYGFRLVSHGCVYCCPMRFLLLLLLCVSQVILCDSMVFL